MSDETLSGDVRGFIAHHINSVEQLEVLLLLKRTSRREWSAAEVARELASTLHSIETRLFDLLSRQLLMSRQVGDAILFWYQGNGFDAIVTQLAEAYAARRVSVISAIFTSANDGLRTYGDSFKIRRKPDQ